MVELIDSFQPWWISRGRSLIPARIFIKPLLTNPEKLGERDYAYNSFRGKILGLRFGTEHCSYSKWPDGEELYDLAKDPQRPRGQRGACRTLKSFVRLYQRSSRRPLDSGIKIYDQRAAQHFSPSTWS